MKPTRSISKLPGLRTVLVSSALALATSSASAQNVVLPFDTNSVFALNATNSVSITNAASQVFSTTNGLSAACWQWWGSAQTVREFDPTQDAGGNPASGSIKITVAWPSTGGDQYSVGLSLSGLGQYDISTSLNPLNYTNVEMDIKWDPASTMNITNHMTGGDPAGWGFGFVATQYGQSWAPNADQPVLINDGQWHHYVIPINSGWPAIPGVIFKKYKNANVADANTTSAFWVDNITFNYNTNVVIPKPKLKLAKATPGLNITMAQAGNQYQRNAVRSIQADTIQWYGNTDPVTYSWTIGEFPSRAEAPGFFATLMLAPNGAGGNGPDWDDPNVVLVETSLNGANQGTCNFRFKTNAPASNGVLYNGGGYLGTLIDPSGVLGTWSLTFTNNSHAVLVGPSGASTNFDMGADAAAFFQSAGSLPTYFGFQPGSPANIGHRGVYSRLKVQNGITIVVDDTFPVEDLTNEADPNLWINRYDGGAIAGKLVDHSGAYWLDWAKPDGFLSFVGGATNLTSGFTDLGQTIRNHGIRSAVFVDTNVTVNFPDALYFRLYGSNPN